MEGLKKIFKKIRDFFSDEHFIVVLAKTLLEGVKYDDNDPEAQEETKNVIKEYNIEDCIKKFYDYTTCDGTKKATNLQLAFTIYKWLEEYAPKSKPVILAKKADNFIGYYFVVKYTAWDGNEYVADPSKGVNAKLFERGKYYKIPLSDFGLENTLFVYKPNEHGDMEFYNFLSIPEEMITKISVSA